MMTKITSLITLVCFIITLVGCYSDYTMERTNMPQERPLEVVSVVTTDGTRYEFEKGMSGGFTTYDDKGLLRDTVVVGFVKDGGLKKIPLSEVQTVTVSQVDAGRTVLAAILIGGAALAVILVAANSGEEEQPKAATGKSCPFVYSNNGSLYVLDGEPLGGAFSEGLKRTDLCRLDHLQPVQDQYQILLRNELDETQFVDEFKLQIVDHRQGVKVFPDAAGHMYTVAHSAPLSRAVDQKGHDRTRWLKESDDYIWETDIRSKDPARAEDLRDSLFLTFPKPRDAKVAYLVVNGGTSFWGSRMVMRMTEIRGELIPGWYQELQSPESMGMIDYWDTREEVLRLQIKVRVGNRWVTRGAIRGNGPYVIEERCIPISLDGVEGDSLELQLAPPAGFWQLNRFVVDYGPQEPVAVQEIAADSIVGNDGSDLRGILKSKDSRYCIMPFTGQEARLVFRVPPLKPGMERTVFAKVAGYYDMHLVAYGEPQREEIRRIENEPGYPAAYALKEYHLWKARSTTARAGAAK